MNLIKSNFYCIEYNIWSLAFYTMAEIASCNNNQSFYFFDIINKILYIVLMVV